MWRRTRTRTRTHRCVGRASFPRSLTIQEIDHSFIIFMIRPPRQPRCPPTLPPLSSLLIRYFYLCPSALHTARSPRHVPIALMPAVTGGLAYGSVHSDMRLAAGHPARNCWSAENEGGPGRVVYRTWSCTPTLEVERWSPPLEPGMI